MLPIRTNPPKPALSLAPHHVLASLVKGEVLSPEKIRATTGGIALHPPTSQSPQPSQKHNTLSPRTNTLASLVKGRWIDGTTQTFALLLSVCDTPTFFYLSNFSAVKTEGLHNNTSLRITFQNRTIPCPAPCPCLPSKKGRWHGCRGFSACCTVFR